MSVTVRGMKISDDTKAARILNSNHDVTPPRPNGVKRFEIGNQTVYAFDQRNAERKAKLYPHLEIIGG